MQHTLKPDNHASISKASATGSRSGIPAVLLSGVLFGTTVPAIKLGLEFLPPDLFVALRFLVASGVVLLLLRRKGWVDWRLLRSRPIWTVGFVNAFGYFLQFRGQDLTTSSDAALIIGTAALIIPLLSWARKSEQITARKGLGVLTGFIGASLVVTRGQALSVGQTQFLGDLLILATAVTIALVFVFSKNLAVQKGGKSTTGGMLLVTAILLVFAIPLDYGANIQLNGEALFIVAFLSIVATIAPYFLLMKGLETVTPTVSSIILPIEVIVAVLLSVLIFNDPFNTYSATGAALIVGGVLLVSSAA